MGILETRKRNPVLWDLVNWELSTGTFTLAQHITDNTASDGWTESADQEIIELLLGALKLCDTETPGERQALYALRQGLVYHRLADVYGRSYRRSCVKPLLGDEANGAAADGRRKKLLQLCRMYYEKGARALLPLQQRCEFVRMQCDRLRFQEFLATSNCTSY